MALETAQLRAFLAVARSGSFTRAADELGCVQSNVTARIRRLEDCVKGRLFTRDRRGAALTPAGERFLQHAEKIMAMLDEAERDVLDVVGNAAPLRLGAMESTAATRLPALMRRLHREFPAAELSLRTGSTDELVRLVEDGKIDAAFVASGVDEGRFSFVDAFDEQLAVAWAHGSAEASALISFRQGCAYRTIAEQWLRSTGRAPVRIVEMGSLDAILGCVAAGMGSAVVPVAVLRKSAHARDLRYEELPAPYGHVCTKLLWRRDRVSPKSLVALRNWLSQPDGQ